MRFAGYILAFLLRGDWSLAGFQQVFMLCSYIEYAC